MAFSLIPTNGAERPEYREQTVCLHDHIEYNETAEAFICHSCNEHFDVEIY